VRRVATRVDGVDRWVAALPASIWTGSAWRRRRVARECPIDILRSVTEAQDITRCDVVGARPLSCVTLVDITVP